MSASGRMTRIHFCLFYFLFFWGLGGLYPLLGIYLKEQVHLSGTQIGTLMSIGPIVMMFTQPVWGMICDWTGRPRAVLTASLVVTGWAGLGFLVFDDYLPLIAVAASLALFQSAIVPISDTLTVTYAIKNRLDYGRFRLWGAAGFAAATFVMGWLSEKWGFSVIFYGFALTLWAGAVSAGRIPDDRVFLRIDLRSGLSRLVHRPRLMLFLLATFLVFGPICANNAYLGLLFQSLGLTVAGVGLGFLLAAGSEIPFMRAAGPWIRKQGPLMVTLLAAGVSGLRWLFYFFEPGIEWVYLSSLAQGFSTGLFIPAALLYVRETAPEEVKTTAVSLYTAAGVGLGNWFCTLVGGWIIDRFDVFTAYLFFGISAGIGTAILFVLRRLETTDRALSKTVKTG